MNDRRIKFGKVGYYVYYRKRSFFSYSMYIYTYTWYGRERKEKKQFKLTRIAREQKRADNTYSVHT